MGDDGTGGGYNPCECILSHEFAMRRLLNVLRNSQALCTDTECFEPGPAPPGRTSPDNLYFLTFAIGIALLLYFFRPRQQINEPMSKPINGNNSNDAPPAPPIN